MLFSTKKEDEDSSNNKLQVDGSTKQVRVDLKAMSMR